MKVWGWGGHNGWTIYTKESRGSRLKVHAAICLKEGGSISNFRSKEGQLKHREVIIYCTSTRVMKDSSHVREAFRSAVFLIACTREAALCNTFITDVAASQPSSLTSTLWSFCRNVKNIQWVFVHFPDFYHPNLVQSALNAIKWYLMALEPIMSTAYCCIRLMQADSAPTVVPVEGERTVLFMCKSIN